MKIIITYLLLLGTIDTTSLLLLHSGQLPNWLTTFELIIQCALVGGIGGVVYCLRAVYLNACVSKSWDKDWHPWYFIRPLVSHFCGAISYLFLKAGLLVLEAQKVSGASDLGFLALAFIAGLNVDKFISKIEDIAQASWGIEKSRVAKGDVKR